MTARTTATGLALHQAAARIEGGAPGLAGSMAATALSPEPLSINGEVIALNPHAADNDSYEAGAGPTAAEVSARSGAPQPAARIGAIVLDDGRGISPEATINSIGEDRSVVYVTAFPDSAEAETAQRLGADVVRLPQVGANPGRGRNAGYRRLKVLDPAVDYVQFLDPGFVLDADWFEHAERFMERRPEVAVVDGFVSVERPNGVAASIGAYSHRNEHGEITTSGGNMFARADAFEAAGGFRGDIPTNDAEDLCIRLRRRGRHVWRAETAMGAQRAGRKSFAGWWRSAKADGRSYAHGANLHGSPPERFRVLEQARAVIWGGAFPVFIVLCAVFMGVGVFVAAPPVNPFLVAAAVLAVGGAVYFGKIAFIALRHGVFKPTAWAYGVFTTFGHVPEFFGVASYYLSPRSKSVASTNN